MTGRRSSPLADSFHFQPLSGPLVPLNLRGSCATVVLLLGLWGTASGAETVSSPPPPGHLRGLAAHRVTVPPSVDGVLNDPAWALRDTADGFWVSEWQQAPTDQTRVVAVYDDRMLYFAFTCLDGQPDLIRATQITRDGGPGLDDRVTIELDPYHNHRSVSRFTVTARGTQSDAIAGGRAGKLEWKGVWHAAVARTAFGWTAEIAIPLAMLEFEADATTFGINFSRYQNRTREWSEWANVTPQRLPEEAGHLTGLRLPETAAPGRLAVMQYVSGAMAPGSDTNDAGELGSGVDVRYQWRRTMTSMVTANPDFSEPAPDVTGIGFSYTGKFVADRRPFFQEGAEFFGDREVFHSGRIEQFDVGVKTFGRVDDYQVGVLATADAGSGRADYVGRIVREIGPTFNMATTVAATRQGAIDNSTLQLQGGGRVGRHVTVDAKVARTSGGGADGDGTRGRGEVAYHASHWYSGGWADRTDAQYVAADGFIAADLPGTAGRGAYSGYNRAFGDAGVRRADASVSYEVRDTTEGLRQRETVSFYSGAETASNIQVNGGVTIGTYRPRGAQPGEWMGSVNDDRYYLASAFYQHPAGRFGYGAQYSWGFVGVQEYDSLAPSVWVAPSAKVSLAYSFERANHDEVQHQHVISGTWQMSGTQSVSARVVDYDGAYYRITYRRILAHSIDAFGIYTSDPWQRARFNVKLVWTWLPSGSL
jgi:hypothetical protein